MADGRRGKLETDERRSKVSLEMVEQREMTDAEVETVVSLLFTWWKREFERERDFAT